METKKRATPDKKSQQSQKRPLAPVNSEGQKSYEKKLKTKGTPGKTEADIQSWTAEDTAIAAHVGWEALPLDIIEKIITHAVSGDKKKGEPKFNWYAERVIKYGAVCPTWKSAIIFSRTIFQRDKSLSSEELCPKRLTINHGCHYITFPTHCRHSGPKNPTLVPTFINEAYVQAVKSLDLLIVAQKDCKLPTSVIVASIADRNSIECLRLEFYCGLSAARLREVNPLVKKLTKADHFELLTRISLGSKMQTKAKWLWELMRSIVHSNSRAKTIKLTCYAYGDLIDWSFINETERLNVGSIDQLTINGRNTIPIEYFSKLADIGTIVDRR